MSARFFGLVIKESIQFSRDRVMLALILFLYTAEIVMCTIALSFDVRDLALAIVDLDRTPASRALAERFLTTPEFRSAGQPRSETEAGRWLVAGRASLVLVIPREFAANLAADRATRVQLVLDGTNSNTAAIARGYALRVISEYEHATLRTSDPATGGAVLPALRVWYNQSLTFSAFMVLSMIAVASMLVGVVQPAASIVREKELGTIEQLMVTPITTLELFLAKTVPAIMMCLLALFPALLVAAVLRSQLESLRNQLDTARQQYAALTGTRGVERLLAGEARNYLPPDWAALDAAARGARGAYAALARDVETITARNAVLTPAQLAMLTPAERASLEEARRSAALLAATSSAALATTSARFDSLQRLIDAIPAARDPKAIADLQARIEVEQAMLTNEQTKLGVLYQTAQAEEWARRQRARERAIADVGSLRRLPPLGL